MGEKWTPLNPLFTLYPSNLWFAFSHLFLHCLGYLRNDKTNLTRVYSLSFRRLIMPVVLTSLPDLERCPESLLTLEHLVLMGIH